MGTDDSLDLNTFLQNVFFASWLNVLLVFVPVSWALHFAGVDDTLVFVFSFLSIVPLAGLLGFATGASASGPLSTISTWA